MRILDEMRGGDKFIGDQIAQFIQNEKEQIKEHDAVVEKRNKQMEKCGEEG